SIASSSVKLFESKDDFYSIVDIANHTPTIIDLLLHIKEEISLRTAKLKYSISDGIFKAHYSIFIDTISSLCGNTESDIYRCRKGTTHVIRGLRLPNDWPAQFRTGKPLNLRMEIDTEEKKRILSIEFAVQIGRD
ncbi:hypothetical protein PENTCL1PPCAC_4148, partial [Pristionchus entomophagus]